MICDDDACRRMFFLDSGLCFNRELVQDDDIISSVRGL